MKKKDPAHRWAGFDFIKYRNIRHRLLLPLASPVFCRTFVFYRIRGIGLHAYISKCKICSYHNQNTQFDINIRRELLE
jgi:hypothetical protein